MADPQPLSPTPAQRRAPPQQQPKAKPKSKPKPDFSERHDDPAQAEELERQQDA